MTIQIPFESSVDSRVINTPQNSWYDTLSVVRNMLTIAMGCMKELKTQAVEKYNAPGMRIAIGEIMSCLASANQFVTGARRIDSL